MKKILLSIFLIFLTHIGLAQVETEAIASSEAKLGQPHTAYLIPIEGQISSPQFFILRRGLKEAMRNQVKTVIIKINTPGGDVGTMLEVMEALDKFDGRTIAFINDEAISAGSFIATACDDIYFTPKGIMGAAAAVLSTGQEIPETMTLKIESYLNAKTRSMTQEHPYRAMIQRAMMDKDYELKIDDKVLKAKGELLTLTAEEAIATYGKPPMPLLAKGITETPETLLTLHFKGEPYQLITYHLTWSEQAAKWLQKLSPVLIGIGLLCLFIEFKTPGFGAFGAIGVAALLIVFASHYLAGLADHQEILIFILGLALMAAEFFIFPGTIIPAATGLILIIGSLIFAMADIWPSDGFIIDPEIFIEPITHLSLGLGLAIVGAIVVIRYLPKSFLWDKLTLSATVPSTRKHNGKTKRFPKKGDTGIATTDLRPMGEIEIDGKRYEAKTGPQMIKKGSSICVTGHDQFTLVVKEITDKDA